MPRRRRKRDPLYRSLPITGRKPRIGSGSGMTHPLTGRKKKRPPFTEGPKL